jgi:hypothetical protein
VKDDMRIKGVSVEMTRKHVVTIPLSGIRGR